MHSKWSVCHICKREKKGKQKISWMEYSRMASKLDWTQFLKETSREYHDKEEYLNNKKPN